MKEIFPEEEYKLRPLSDEHPGLAGQAPAVARAPTRSGASSTAAAPSSSTRPRTSPATGTRPSALADNTAVILATKVGQNVIDYATGKELPADKLVVREVHDFKADPAKRGALRIAKLQHAGDWNVAPLAIPNLMDALRRPPLSFDVVVNHKELFPRDPSLIYYPLIYIHGRASFSFTKEDLDALRRHIEPGGGTLFADAACGSPAFDAAFRRFVAELLPGQPHWCRSPATTSSTPPRSASTSPTPSTPRPPAAARTFPSSRVSRSTATGRSSTPSSTSAAPWNGTPGSTARATTYESALKIAANIVIYATLALSTTMTEDIYRRAISLTQAMYSAESNFFRVLS